MGHRGVRHGGPRAALRHRTHLGRGEGGAVLDGGPAIQAARFTLHKTIKLNGKTATITRIGVMDTDFLVLNGTGTHHSQLEFITVPNLALDGQKISRLVRVYEDDNA